MGGEPRVVHSAPMQKENGFLDAETGHYYFCEDKTEQPKVQCLDIATGDVTELAKLPSVEGGSELPSVMPCLLDDGYLLVNVYVRDSDGKLVLQEYGVELATGQVTSLGKTPSGNERMNHLFYVLPDSYIFVPVAGEDWMSVTKKDFWAGGMEGTSVPNLIKLSFE